MKRILKPVGHCLTTIAMTSAMFEAYPAAAEAAPPQPSAPTESAPATPQQAVPLADEVTLTPRVVPPERMGTVEQSSKSESSGTARQRKTAAAPSANSATTQTAPVQSETGAIAESQQQAPARSTAATPSTSPTPAPANSSTVAPRHEASAAPPQAAGQPTEATVESQAGGTSSAGRASEPPATGEPTGARSGVEATSPLPSETTAGEPTDPAAIAPSSSNAAQTGETTPAEPTAADAPASLERFANTEVPSLEFTTETVAVPALHQLQTATPTTDPLTGQVVNQPEVAATPTPAAVPVTVNPPVVNQARAATALQVPCIPLSPNFTAPRQVAAAGTVLARSQTVPLPPPPGVATLPPGATSPAARRSEGTPLPPLTALIPTAASPNDFVARVPKPATDTSVALPAIALANNNVDSIAEQSFSAKQNPLEQGQFAASEEEMGDRTTVTLPQKEQQSLLADKPSVGLTADKLVSKNLNALLDQVGMTDFLNLPPLLQAFWQNSTTDPAELMAQTQSTINLPAKTAISIVKRTVQPTWELAAIGQQLPSLRLSEGADASKVQDVAMTDLPKVMVPAIASNLRLTAVNASANTTDCLTGTWARMFNTIAPDRLFSWGGLVFPLPIRVPLTSGFGWRIHPITGDRRMHAGVDFGAPQGTPVLAAMPGRVVAAQTIGGYGLTVVLEDERMQRRTLYAHLSAIAVQPGARVEAGSVIGLVGSTGFSTGPHLHFEVQALTTSGWVAVDPIIAAAQLAQRNGIPANLGGGETRVAQGVEPRSRREE